MRAWLSPGFALLVGLAVVPSVPAVAEDVREPKLVSVTDAQLKEGTTARASRNYAWMGYNTPEITLQLPAVDNSAYAEVTFEPARLSDKSGKPVAHEVETGIWMPDLHGFDVRFTPKNAKPDAPPVEFSKAVGTIKVRYPATARTVVIKAGAPVTAGGAKLSLKGSSLIVESPGNWKMLETPFGSGFEEPLRAYNAAGKRLEEDPGQRLQESGETGTRTTRVFKGAVSQVRLDVVDEWAEMDVAYDLAPLPKLPADKAGMTPEGGAVGGPSVHPTAVRRVKN